MARLDLTKPRSIDTVDLHLGRVLLFCEGLTECNYFNHFSVIIRNAGNKFASIELVCVPANGNARAVLDYAETYLSHPDHIIRYREFETFLVFDCDSPTDIESVLEQALRDNKYGLLLTNKSFETWLLMHFEHPQPGGSPSNRTIRTALARNLDRRSFGKREKSSPGLIRKIIGDGSSVHFAIENAERLRESYFPDGENMDRLTAEIRETDPYTRVDILMKRILVTYSR